MLGLAAAYAIHRRMLPFWALTSLFMAPLIVPSVVLGVALLGQSRQFGPSMAEPTRSWRRGAGTGRWAGGEGGRAPIAQIALFW